MEDTYSLGQAGYEAYGDHQDWKNYVGHPMPPWDEVRDDIQAAWEHAAQVIVEKWRQ